MSLDALVSNVAITIPPALIIVSVLGATATLVSNLSQSATASDNNFEDICGKLRSSLDHINEVQKGPLDARTSKELDRIALELVACETCLRASSHDLLVNPPTVSERLQDAIGPGTSRATVVEAELSFKVSRAQVTLLKTLSEMYSVRHEQQLDSMF
ncbi:uncharacterized protein PHACADRAFT_202307 [Phanerochaete carnosa HHB-10118-sp]|uniref:Uncharacterized protein n=1 Tax=Phanerochaete carnosa (strain HHB-10118-sp) TaxID=650164 RepID=K5VQ61_PHACS|nr:uncharacterized protein PHACADRAFT_202307 [Phanerochaete carnosa HHB-10118-sp]EKM48860.1 hypothetical protein PHACADRAFT_202307 [Phanerochaete carnosa HHB-10118-sp]